MKKLLIFLCLIPLFFGCEVYDQPSRPQLTGGKWIFNDYKIVIINSIGDVVPIENDTICINSFNMQTQINGDIIMKQYYGDTSPEKRFVKNRTTWEFDNSGYTLYCGENYNRMARLDVTFPKYMRREYTEMEISGLSGDKTNYTFFTDAIGVNYPRKLTLTSPNITTDLLLSEARRELAVTIRIVLIFTR